MSQDYFQDVTPPARAQGPQAPARSIRNIAPSANRPRTSRTPIPPSNNNSSMSTSSKRHPNFLLWGIAVVILAVVGFFAATLFLNTTVTVTPRSQTTVFDAQTTYVAYSSDEDATSGGSLIYSTDTKQVSASAAIVASGSEEVSIGASGTITIYNDFSETSQRLIPNTRFETPNGLIYRVQNAIVVPGKNGSTPGSITATVYADEAGEEYNIGPVDRFSVPGLRDTPDMYASIYASSAESMTGGFVGTRPSISDSAKASTQAQLEEEIRAKIAEMYSDTSEHYTLTRLARINYAPLRTDLSDDGNAQATLTADVTVPRITRAALDSFLASETSATVGAASVHIDDPSSFSLLPTSDEAPVLGEDEVSFSLSGKAAFIWDLDTDALISDLVGKDKGAFETVVGGYAAIDTATAKIYPIWSNTFPTSPEDIEVVLLDPMLSQ